MAASTRQSKVLRIGIIQDGKIVQERLVKAGEAVSVGESSRNTFVFPKTKIRAAQYVLFEWRDGQYHLNFTEEMRGKVSSGGAIIGLDKVRQDSTVPCKDGMWSLPLTEHDRGKVGIAPVTVLFQFVAPPPAQALKPIAAMDFRPRLLDEEDPILLGFLAIWSALAIVFSVWVYNTEPVQTSIDEMPDRFTRIVLDKPAKPEVEQKKPEKTEEKKPEKKEAQVDGAKTTTTKPKTKKPKKKETKVEKARRIEASKKQLLKESKLMARLIGSTGDRTRGLVSANAADGNFQNMAAKIKKAADTVASIDGAGGIRSGSKSTGGNRDIGAISSGKVGSTSVAAAPKVQVSGRVTYDEPEVSGGDLSGVKKIVARYRGQLKYCYEAALKTNPKLSGRVVIGWTVMGEKAADVYIAQNTTGDENFANCMRGKVKRWKFTGVEEGDVKMPFVFQPNE